MRIAGLLQIQKQDGLELQISVAECSVSDMNCVLDTVRRVFDPVMIRQYAVGNHNNHHNEQRQGIEEYRLVYSALPSQIMCNINKLPDGGSACTSIIVTSSHGKCAELVKGLADAGAAVDRACNGSYCTILACLADKVN